MTEYPDDLEVVPRRLQSGQRAEVWIAEVGDRAAELVYSTDTLLLEAPNWAPDGRGLLLNGDGLLWRLDLGPEVELERVPIDDLPPINNDHVLDAERGLVYLSANDGHIYVAPIQGGSAKRVTHDSSRYHFLHGVSPDGMTLASSNYRAPTPRFPVGLHSYRRPEARRAIPKPAAGTSMARSIRPTAPGCISTPRSSPAARATRNWPARPPKAATLSVWWSRSRLIGSRTCRRTANLPAISAFRRARSGIRPTWTWRCGWFAPQNGARSCGASRCWAGREPSMSTAGRRTVVGSHLWRIRCNTREPGRGCMTELRPSSGGRLVGSVGAAW
jgi:hypothetical protein